MSIRRETFDVPQIGPTLPNLESDEFCRSAGVKRDLREDLTESLTWIEVVDGNPSYPRCESLIQPQLAPPIHGDQVAKPLMCKL